MRPCVFAVMVLPDGVGDLFHYIDFLSVLATEDLQNAYYIIKTVGRDKYPQQYQRVASIMRDLDEVHPLKKYQDRIAIIDQSGDAATRSLDLAYNKISSDAPINTYFISFSSPNSSFWKIAASRGCCAFLSEHHGANILDSKNFLTFLNSMGVSPISPGIFIGNTKINCNYNPNSEIFKKFNIAQDDLLTICYSHIDMQNAVIYLCHLHKIIAPTKKLILFFPKARSNISPEIVTLLSDSNCRLIDNNDWISEQDFIQLKIKQANSAFLGLAAGDNTTEDCFSEGLFPVIQTNKLKHRFWKGLIETLKQEPFNNNVEIAKIVTYIKRAIEDINLIPDRGSSLDRTSPYAKLLHAIQDLNPQCFKVWKEWVCPHIRKNYNLFDNIQRNVKLFRMSSELTFNLQDIFAEKAKSFFKNMEQSEFDAFIDALVTGIIRKKDPSGSYFNVRHAQYLKALLQLRESKIVTTDVKSKMLEIIAKEAPSPKISKKLKA